MIIDFLKHRRLNFRVNRVKRAIVDCRPIVEKDDYAIVGFLGILASINIFKEFLKIDSKNEKEFEETKKYFLVVMQDQINKFKKLEYKKPKNNKNVVEIEGIEKNE